MDIEDPKKLHKLVNFCRKNGITSLKSGDFEISFSPSALFPESESKKKNLQPEVPIVSDTIYTEEDLLNWSSAGIPEGNN